MKNIIIITLIILLLALGCNTTDDSSEEPQKPKIGLSKYPDVFVENNTFNAKVVVDDYAPEEELGIALNFGDALEKEYKLERFTLIHYKHLKELYNENAIFIGTCNIRPQNKFVNLFMDCLSMEDNIGMLRLVEKDNITIISVVGKNLKDTEEAVSVLINHEKYNLSGNEIQVRNDEKGDLFVRITG